MARPIAIIAGIGPGTGASVARKFAASYPVALLARTPESYNPLVDEINKSGGSAIGVSADVSNSDSIKKAFDEIKAKYGGEDAQCAAAVFNASGAFYRKPFLELTEDQFMSGLDVSARGAFLFSRASLPLLLKSAQSSPNHPPTLVFTGATASVKSNAFMSSFSTGKFALKALSQSLGKEFGPKGIHVAHAVIDGVIDIERTKEWMKEAGPDAKISPNEIANAYWHLHTQPRSAFSNEIDIRPYCEKW
ncbi:MAG: hypothetical protein M1828_007418 [Chrysothrix sp. TS-e1954]|nr:MAG: hypothetical protein M1828_007418 [Chrysothrix sp. TS-e1954]